MTKETSYTEQLALLENYFREGEKKRENYRLGLEMEHFILEEKTLRAVSYSGAGGVAEILSEMVSKDWQPIYEDGSLIGLQGREAIVTLEPGSQIELSIKPCSTLTELEKIYRDFRERIIPLLTQRGYLLVTLGYQPESPVEDIELIPKERYKYMFKYFEERGEYAHNMMKGTASVQVNLDYQDEEDYRKKVRVASYLTPLVYNLLDNSPFFERHLCYEKSMREEIWQNCDRDRCGLFKDAFKSDYSYRDYARYLLEIPAIINIKDGRLKYTGGRKIRDLIIPGQTDKKQLTHLVSMAFPDIRTKSYLEIRMGDSLPFEYSLGYLAFWKGLFYHQENLDQLYREARKVSWMDMLKIRGDIKRKGLEAEYQGIPLFEKYRGLLSLSRKGLTPPERDYLAPLEELAREKQIPKMITLNSLSQGKREAIDWCT